ncbi:hypothetical protein [Haloparvum sedimenti]|uniref:hypothetical protein n=1 Tax=Haloparvum sedimenti TaxID=1678448 RepID=UPI00071E7610|nr:hypothetical protein [Haloparvum sedimenti]
MSLADSYDRDLRELVDTLDERGVLQPGEKEAWTDGLDDAEHVSDYARLNDSLVSVLGDRDGLPEALEEHSFNPETDAFF